MSGRATGAPPAFRSIPYRVIPPDTGLASGRAYDTGAETQTCKPPGGPGGDSQEQISPNGVLAAIGYYPNSCRGVLCTALSACLPGDRKSTRLNSSHLGISYAVFCL